MGTWKRLTTIGLTFTLAIATLMGCDTKSTPSDNGTVKENTQKPATEETQGTETGTSDKTDTDNQVFAEMAKYGYTFASGVGAWSTELNVHGDGSFDGGYSDSDMGSTGDDYPNGTRYVSNFSGQFTEPEKVDEYTYKTTISKITYDNTVGKEEIEDGIKYVYTTASGLDNAKDIYIYTKGASVNKLPEGYISWVSYMLDDATELPWYGIYNEADDCGFFGWDKDSDQEESVDTGSGIEEELQNLESKAKDIETQLESGSLTQDKMNSLSGELYSLWDDELNSIWGRLKDKLDSDTMSELTQKEREWVADKEEKVKKAGSEWEGGSGQPLAENTEGAELTRARVYELAEYLK